MEVEKVLGKIKRKIDEYEEWCREMLDEDYDTIEYKEFIRGKQEKEAENVVKEIKKLIDKYKGDE